MAKKRGGRASRRRFDPARQLDPIYNQLDNGNNTKAIKMINTACSKYGRVPLLLALRSLAEVRLGRTAEGLNTAEEARSTSGGDPQVLRTLLMVYKTSGSPELGARAYKEAWAQNPANEEMGLGLYFSLGRIHNYAEQQKCALKLFKATGNRKYMYWAAMSILHKAQVDPKSAKLLFLAESMIKKHCIGADTAAAGEYIRGYIKCLSDQKDATKQKLALKILTSDESKAWKEPSAKARAAVKIMGRLGMHGKRAAALLKLLRSESDDWEYWIQFIEAHADSAGEGWQRGALAVAKSFQAKAVKSRIRGPFLAECHVHHTAALRARDDAKSRAASMEALAASLASYYGKFGGKTCAFLDTKLYLQSLGSGSKREELLRRLKTVRARALEGREKGSVQYLTAAINAKKASRYAGVEAELDAKQLVALAIENVELYRTSMALNKGLKETERTPGDDLAILAAHQLMQAHRDAAESARSATQYLFDAILVLELALQNSKNNYQVKLILARLYAHPGVMSVLRSLTLFNSMDIKQIQLDALLHLIVPDAVRAGLFDSAEALCARLCRFHQDHNVEGPEMIVMAYKNAHYHQVLEFVDFRLRLTRSLARYIAETCGFWSNIASGPKTHPALTETVESHVEVVSKMAQSRGFPPSLAGRLRDCDGATGGQAPQYCQQFVSNLDVEAIHCYDPPGADGTDAWLRVVLNRPADAISLDSFDSPVSTLQPQGGPAAAKDVRYFTLCETLVFCLKSLLKCDPKVMEAASRRLGQRVAERKAEDAGDQESLQALQGLFECGLRLLSLLRPGSKTKKAKPQKAAAQVQTAESVPDASADAKVDAKDSELKARMDNL